jgi:hypothetical protein
MTEATGFEAKTIHRLLEADPQRGGFERGDDNPLDAFFWSSTRPPCPNSAKKVSIGKVSTTRRWLGGERSFLAR